MNDDWRLQVVLLEGNERAPALIQRLHAHQLHHDLSQVFHDRVVVTEDDSRVFLYAGTREQAVKACNLVQKDARQQGWAVDVELRHWHPASERWEDPDKPLPADEAALRSERNALMVREREESVRRGYPEYEVRVDLPSHHDAMMLYEELRTEGLLPVHRWKYLLVGATDEDNAKALAQRIQSKAPVDSRVTVEGTWAAILGGRTPNPFSIL